MNYCQRGKDLLVALQRSDWLPIYDEEGVRSVAKEMVDISMVMRSFAALGAVDNLPNAVRGTLIYYHQCISRNRRYLLAYVTHRLERVRNLKWEIGFVIPPDIRKILSEPENDYFMEYNSIINDYSAEIGVDLSSDLEPPKELFIQVRVLEDCGELLTFNGQIVLDKGTTQFVRRSDVEHLIRQGSLVQLDTDQA